MMNLLIKNQLYPYFLIILSCVLYLSSRGSEKCEVNLTLLVPLSQRKEDHEYSVALLTSFAFGISLLNLNRHHRHYQLLQNPCSN